MTSAPKLITCNVKTKFIKSGMALVIFDRNYITVCMYGKKHASYEALVFTVSITVRVPI